MYPVDNVGKLNALTLLQPSTPLTTADVGKPCKVAAGNICELCTNGDEIDYVLTSIARDNLTVGVERQGIKELIASAAITAGMFVVSAGSGKIKATASSGTVRSSAKAFESAAADGDVLEVAIN